MKPTMFAIATAALLLVAPGAHAIQFFFPELGELTVINEQASALAEDETVYGTGCNTYKIEVTWEYDGSGQRGNFEGSSDHGGGFNFPKFVASNGDEFIETNQCVLPGETVIYEICATAYDDNGNEVSHRCDTGRVVYLLEFQ